MALAVWAGVAAVNGEAEVGEALAADLPEPWPLELGSKGSRLRGESGAIAS